jgi:hypothetical protein
MLPSIFLDALRRRADNALQTWNKEIMRSVKSSNYAWNAGAGESRAAMN